MPRLPATTCCASCLTSPHCSGRSKILATTLGETAGDYFSQTLGLGTLRAAVLLLAIFLVAVTIQLRASRFHPALFWTVVVLTSTAGTTISDSINYTSHLGQATGALILGSGLALVLLVWWRSGQTLNVENVATLTGEVLFWIAVVFSNSLGTSTGDYLAGGLGLGLPTRCAGAHGGHAGAVGRALLHQYQRHAAVLDRLHPDPPLGRCGGQHPELEPRSRRTGVG